MPRKAFVADLATAAEQNIPGVTAVARGADDNEVVVCFSAAGGALIEITLMAQPGMYSRYFLTVMRTCSFQWPKLLYRSLSLI